MRNPAIFIGRSHEINYPVVNGERFGATWSSIIHSSRKIWGAQLELRMEFPNHMIVNGFCCVASSPRVELEWRTTGI